MKKIKITGAFILIFSIILAFIFNFTSKNISEYNNKIAVMNIQKNFTQEISKNIFYSYKHQDDSFQTLDNSIKLFLESMSDEDIGLQKNEKIRKLWNKFYLHVQNFRDHVKRESIYSNIILEKEIKEIYNINLELILESDLFIEQQIKLFNKTQNSYKTIQYILFLVLVLLLLYLFTQLKIVMNFIQKFLSTSKEIISNSSIKTLKPLDIQESNNEIFEAEENFNLLIKKINSSIESSSNSMEYTYKSLEIVEQNIENLVELIYAMNENSRDKELRNKEDAIIQSFEELGSSMKKLINLKNELDDLISYTKS
jgi:methyl-accepting chemotaxis protein